MGAGCAILPVVTWGELGTDGLLELTGDPFVRYAVPPDALALAGPWGWAALGRWRPAGHWGGLAVVGPDGPRQAESEMLDALTFRLAGRGSSPEWFSTVGEGRKLWAPPGLRVDGSGRWAFMWTTSTTGLPPAPDGLVALDDTADAAQIETFGRGHNPHFEGFPGHGFATCWLGVRDADGLAAVGALHELASGAPHLAGLIVRPDRRGSGLGTALTAELTRRAVAGHGACTLGVYSDNATAVRLYERLGYATAHHLHTRNLVPADHPEAG